VRPGAARAVGPEASALAALAPAKINMGLFVGQARADRRHELVTVMQAISLADRVQLELTAGARDEVLCPDVGCAPQENLAARALVLLRTRAARELPPLRLQIEKSIPVAGGLAGGSADAGAALRLAAPLISSRSERAVRGAQLLALAAELGADVPAQLAPGRYLARGAGERLEALAQPADECGVLVIALARELASGAVYAEAERMRSPRSAAELEELASALRVALCEGAVLPPPELLANDLQSAACALCPDIEVALALGAQAGAKPVMVSGSGPSVVGLFPGRDGLARAQRAAAELRAQLQPCKRAPERGARDAPTPAGAIAAIHAASFVASDFALPRALASSQAPREGG